MTDGVVFKNVQSIHYFDGGEHRWLKAYPGELLLLDEAVSQLKAERARSTKLLEALRKALLWADCIQARIIQDRDWINWRYLNEARAEYEAGK